MMRVTWHFLLLWTCSLVVFVLPSQASANEQKQGHALHTITLSQMGFANGLELSQGQVETGAQFTIPDDQFATDGELVMHLQGSPDLVKQKNTLAISLNGQTLGTVSLGMMVNGKASYQLAIPSVLIASSNSLTFHLLGVSQLQCTPAEQGGYQLTILPSTHIDTQEARLNVMEDLSLFPKPFLDKHIMGINHITFAFPAELTESEVSAATLLASWFGIQADYHGVDFDTMQDTLPLKDGILIGRPGDEIGGIHLPQTPQPLIKIISNPLNPVYKLLLVVGNDRSALINAVWQLTHGHFPTNTTVAKVYQQSIPAHQAYDAPRWINTTHPVRLSELLKHRQQDISVEGIWHTPLRVHFRSAPDLTLWDGSTIPLHLSYHFPVADWIDEQHSFLNLNLNHQFLGNLSINKRGLLEQLWQKLGFDIRQETADIPIEPFMIYGDNELSLYFNIVKKDTAQCKVLADTNIKSVIENDSWIDLSHSYHYALMPNLSFFIGASFPFSRMADFSQSSLLLPAHPTLGQLNTLFNFAGHAGDNTGVALARNRVFFGLPTHADDQRYFHHSDILAVTTMQERDLNYALLTPETPFTVLNTTLKVRPMPQWKQWLYRLTGHWQFSALQANRYISSHQSWRGFISYQSPWDHQRIVVTALASDDHQLQKLGRDIRSHQVNSDIRGDMTMITDQDSVRSFQVAPTFASGQLPWYLTLVWYTSQHFVILGLMGVMVCLIFGLALYLVMKRRAHCRMDQQADQESQL